MSKNELKSMYRTVNKDSFPAKMEISFYDNKDNRQTLIYDKVEWTIENEKKGLRYGENPDQPAAFYRLTNGNLTLGGVSMIQPGRYLVSDTELLQSGKHPGKTNITDADNALNILRYFQDQPAAVIVKHNNPCGVAIGDTLVDSYIKALMADRVAAFGGTVALNRSVDTETAELIASSYCEVVVAPDFEPGALNVFSRKKNLRILKIGKMDSLRDFIGEKFLDFKSVMDGGLIIQWSFTPQYSLDDFIPAVTTYNNQEYRVNRKPSRKELEDMLFGWLVESGITSNSVIYVRDGVTVGIGTGEQDRVGVAEIARDKAYKKLADRTAWERYKTPWNLLTDPEKRSEIQADVDRKRGGLLGSVMISDAFFPFRDGIDVGLNEGVKAVIQPGGSMRDFESIQACNENDAAMVFTGQRSFKH